ncbi:UPL7 [Symbiodinium pilosum]|uniref:HECT-type E3 ubiquitin transferase n=1 Tax=Symbiodinium pilosum TaxID=2952 RepID=A0A812LAJ7_SYMPI|nr:UPL7 [Symbiodinium pilosum]
MVNLMCSGLDAISLATVEQSLRSRQELLALLLSAPQIGESLCASEEMAKPSLVQSLRRLCSLIVRTAGVLGATSRNRTCSAAHVLVNMVVILERFALHHESGFSSASELLAFLHWLAWAKEQMGHGAEDAKASAKAALALNRGSFARLLLSSVDRGRDDILLAICRLYFAPSDGTAEAECDPPQEVLQTLAFATPLAERLFPTFRGLMRNRSAEEVFDALGPPALASPEAIRLRVFCSVYALQLQPMYDYEFFGAANPLRLDEVRELLPFLNRLTYHFVITMPDQAVLLPAAKALRGSLTSLINLLYHRHRRKAILESDSAWIIPESRALLRRAPSAINLGVDLPDEPMEPAQDEQDEDELMEVDEDAGQATERGAMPSATSSQSLAERALQATLAEIPHVLPFEDRVSVLHGAILADQEERRAYRGPWGPSAMDKHQIRRNFLVEDGIAAFEGLDDEQGLRDTFRVEFIAPDGTPESGVDGGGLFKEFMVHICREMFDPEFGLFSATSDHTLYPATSAFAKYRQAADLYTFLGKVVGKAIYEMFLLEPQFSRVFLNRLLGRVNEVDDIASLDKELHKNMLQIKECSDVEALGITFSISVTEKGVHKDIDLIPGGSDTPVTCENLTRYLHLMANYRTNVQFQRHNAAFLSGLQKVLPVAWLKMFDPYELNTLISGSTAGFDVKDLRANTVLSGGYQDDSPCVVWLWKLLQEDLEPEDMGRFLMFCTSCSRAPLLGFQNLNPKFCVHRVPDSERLPTSATCANLLKLPDYVSYESLKSKVLQAIRAEAGFDLS